MVWRKEGNGRFDPPGLFRFLVSFSPFQCSYTQLLIILMATTTTRMAARMTRTIRRYSVIPMLSSFAGSTGVGSGVGLAEGTAPETMKAISDTGAEITVGTTGVTMDIISDVIDNLSSKVGDESVHQLGGKVTVTLPYTLVEGQNPNSVKVYYVDDDANLHQMVSKYDAERGVVVIVTAIMCIGALVMIGRR